MPIEGVGSHSAATSSEVVQFKISPHFKSTFSCKVQAIVLPQISSYVPPKWEGNIRWPHLENFDLADPNFIKKGRIDLLLGASVHAQIIKGRVVEGNVNEPITSLSRLGWLVSGDCSPRSQAEAEAFASLCVQLQPLDEMLERFWTLKEIPKANLYTADEHECENHFVDTHSRDVTGRYIVRLPFKTPIDSLPFLGDSYSVALRSLQRMETRFQKDEKLKDAYMQFMAVYPYLKHMIRASDSPVCKEIAQSFFLPRHGVWKESSTTTKLRTVFNGTARTRSGKSLNELLHLGPNLLPTCRFSMRMARL